MKLSNALRLLSFALLLPVIGISQEKEKFSDNLKIIVNYQQGFGLPEYSALDYVFNDFARAVDVAVIKERNGRDDFERLYNYPENGVAFFFMSLGNKEILGEAYGINYLFRLNIVQTKRFRLFNRMGIGLAYLTRKNNYVFNPMNVVIGSNINIHYNCRFGAGFKITDRWELNAGASFDHYSNGNTAEPNVGLNYLTFYGGALCRVGQATERNTDPVAKNKRELYWELFANIGAKHTRSFSSTYYGTASLGGEMGYTLFKGFHLGTGVDFFYDASIESQLNDAGKEYDPVDQFQSGIHVSQTVAYRKFRFTLQEGFYLGLREPINNSFMYNRAILKFAVSEHWNIRLAMKSHLHILDYPEIGCSYKF